ncbi:Hypothetical predicted protein [Cloeon dipterum]|uniref:C2H2-type domain-containing protein n=2 Tax=Cloeon dipterum TaxID=197152 RepID=A0A8S1CUQ6_9INSE|nr:Hypothetical predicted protein [Cloeon dipterum]
MRAQSFMSLVFKNNNCSAVPSNPNQTTKSRGSLLTAEISDYTSIYGWSAKVWSWRPHRVMKRMADSSAPHLFGSLECKKNASNMLRTFHSPRLSRVTSTSSLKSFASDSGDYVNMSGMSKSTVYSTPDYVDMSGIRRTSSFSSSVSSTTQSEYEDMTSYCSLLPRGPSSSYKKTILATYKCELCSKEFNQKKLMIDHKLAEHQRINQFTHCPYCSYSCKCKITLERHVTREHANSFLQCLDCSKRFATPSSLKEHNLKCHVHYKCLYCKQPMKEVNNVSYHEMSRNCNKCGSKFNCVWLFARHWRLHPEQIHCPLCPQTFDSASAFEIHLEWVHFGFDKKCEYFC